jgi:hypothetical protein
MASNAPVVILIFFLLAAGPSLVSSSEPLNAEGTYAR